MSTETWEVWYPKAAATGLLVGRGLLDATSRLLVHAAPDVITVEVSDESGTRLASHRSSSALRPCRSACSPATAPRSCATTSGRTKRIDNVRGEIERTRGRINLFDDQSAYATLNVTLAAIPVVATMPAPSGAPSPVEVLEDALAISSDMVHVIVNALVVLAVAGLWILPAGIALLLVRRRYGRRLIALWSRLLSW